MSWKVRLTWDEGAPSAQGTGFKVYKSVDGGSYALVATLGISTTSWDDTDVSEGHKYQYHVTEYNDINGGESPYASVAVYMPSANTEIAVRVRIDGSVDVSWDQRTYNLGYRLERQTDGGAWGLVTETSTNDTNHVDSVGTTTGKTYKYRVRPKGTTGYAPAWQTSDDHYYATKKVHLTWDEGGTGTHQHGDGYKIYRKLSGGTYALWKTITGIGTTTYDDPDIVDNTYYYKVTERKDDLEDEAAETSIEVVLNTAPTAPTGLLCEGLTNPTAVTDTTPEFSAIYNDPDSGDTSTQVYVQVNTASDFTGTVMWDSGWLTIASVTAGNRCADISYAGTALALSGDDYYWRIRFKDASGAEGAWSAAATFTMRKDFTLSDAGVGVDTTPVITAQISVAENGVGADAAPDVKVPIGVVDAGIGTEGLPDISAALSVVDTGAGQDTVIPIEVRLVLVDSGSGAETVLAWHPVSIADAGAALDSIASILAQMGVTDAGIGHDDSGLLVISQFTVVDDGGVGTDTAPQIAVTLPVLSDLGVGTDTAPQIAVTLPVLSDLGVGTDVIAIKAIFSLTDAATGTDVITLTTQVPVADAGMGVDSIAGLLAQIPVTDAGVGQEMLDLLVSFGLTDAGTSQDLLSLVKAFIAIADAGTGTDSNPVTGNWIPKVAIDVQYPEEPDIEYDMD
jgi:hypothetical protein